MFFRNLYWSLPTFCSSLISARGREVSVSTCCGEPRGTPRDSEWLWKVLVTSNWKTFLQDLLKCLSLIMVGNVQYKTVYSWRYKNLCNVLLHIDTQRNKIFVWTPSVSYTVAIRQGEFHINVQCTMWLRTYMYLLQALYFYELFNKEQDIFFF